MKGVFGDSPIEQGLVRVLAVGVSQFLVQFDRLARSADQGLCYVTSVGCLAHPLKGATTNQWG
jgi:hypothetical protein